MAFLLYAFQAALLSDNFSVAMNGRLPGSATESSSSSPPPAALWTYRCTSRLPSNLFSPLPKPAARGICVVLPCLFIPVLASPVAGLFLSQTRSMVMFISCVPIPQAVGFDIYPKCFAGPDVFNGFSGRILRHNRGKMLTNVAFFVGRAPLRRKCVFCDFDDICAAELLPVCPRMILA